jgi:hypothetical protein
MASKAITTKVGIKILRSIYSTPLIILEQEERSHLSARLED